MMRAGPNRAYYLKKRADGHTHAQAVITLARRRIDVLWALLRDDRTFTNRGARPLGLRQRFRSGRPVRSFAVSFLVRLRSPP